MENKESINFLKTRDVLSPSRAYKTDAGIDFFVPKFDKTFVEDLKKKNESLFVVTQNEPAFSTLTITSQNSSSSVNYNLKDNNPSCIKFDDIEGKNYFVIAPHSRVLIPSGIHLKMANEGRAFIATNKSGVASKLGLVVGATTVDYSYKGEIHLNVINTSTKLVRIYEDMKLVQFIETPVFNSEIQIEEGNPMAECIDNFYKDMINDRGAGGFGSTDKKGNLTNKNKTQINS
jgi:dUTPase